MTKRTSCSRMIVRTWIKVRTSSDLQVVSFTGIIRVHKGEKERKAKKESC